MTDTFVRRFHLRTLVVSALVLSACGGDPPVPTTATATTSQAATATVATTVSTIPTVKVLDGRGNSMKNVLVRWRVTAGGGKVLNDSIRTSNFGDATSGGWTLGTTAGAQTLQATAEGISAPVTFTADAAPGPVARVVRLSADAQQAVVNTPVPAAPSARVEDVYANPIPNVPVTFSTSDGGTIDGAQQTTNAQGVATATSWKLGISATQQFARASATGSFQAAFSATALPDAPANLLKAGGDNQQGVTGASIATPPGVRVVDQYNNPVGGVPVTFTPGPNSGTVTGGTTQTDPATGVAFVSSWVLGSGAAQTLIATSSLVPGKSVAFAATATSSAFKIDIRFIGNGGTQRQRDAFTKAAAKWRTIIVGHVHDVRVTAPDSACGDWTPAINEIVSDLVVFARIGPIDGAGKVLAQAGPCYVNSASRLTLVGVMEFDEADVPGLLNTGTIDDVVLHEMGHVLGIGTLWSYRRTLLTGSGTSDPFFTGASARAEFPTIGGAIFSGSVVPVENQGGAGTRDAHWRNSVFGRELMQGFASAGGMPLSRVTAASLADLGYVIAIGNADPFRLAGSLRAGPTVQIPLANDVLDGPLYEVSPGNSKPRLVRAGSARQK